MNTAFHIASEPAVIAKTNPRAGLPLDGQRFGKFLLVGELARGGMAEVLLAIQEGIEGFFKVVVIKRILPQISDSPDFLHMFADEARVTARLEHPNLIRTLEFGEQDGQYFTVMEYLAGEDLRHVLKRVAAAGHSLPVGLVAWILIRVCHGLHFAHELTDSAGQPLDLVHRDITPANIVLTYGGEVKLIDFGVAKTSANTSQTRVGTIKGKLAYMSPEQVSGRPIDRRSDVFSTGVVLWELLTARRLFARADDVSTLHAVLKAPVPAPSTLRDDVPPALDAIVSRALARNPDERYPSAEAMASALEELLATQPTIDGRVLGRTLEQLFGSARADAKRAIAQSRSLAHNVAFVMKPLAKGSNVSCLEVASAESPIEPSQPIRADRKLTGVILLTLATIACGLGYLTWRGQPAITPPATTASVRIETTPPGAAILLEGEPTGLTTPATLAGLAPGRVQLALDLDGHRPITDVLSLAAGESASRQYSFARLSGRLVLAGLPVGAVFMIDKSEYAAGEVVRVPTGKHTLRIVAEGRTLIDQQIETGATDHVLRLQGDRLVPQ